MAGLRARNESLRAEKVEAGQLADEKRNDSPEFIWGSQQMRSVHCMSFPR